MDLAQQEQRQEHSSWLRHWVDREQFLFLPWSSLALAVRVYRVSQAKLEKLQVVVVVVSSQGRQMGCELAARGESGGW